MRRRVVPLVLFSVCVAILTSLVTLGSVVSRGALVSTSAFGAPAPLADRVSVAISKRAHKTVRDSVGVWDAATGRRLFMRNADTPRRTASVMKLATTAAALLTLGADYEMAVEIWAARAPVGGVVTGDLVVEGTGDPGLSGHLEPDGADGALRRLAESVRGAGITRVTGDLVLDTSAFVGPDRHPGWGWEPGDYNWYSAPISALTIADGCIDVTVAPGPSPRAPARISVAPSGAPVKFDNRLKSTTSKKAHKLIFGLPDADGRLRATGAVYQESTLSIACVDPPTVFGGALRHALAEAGVHVAGRTEIVRGPPAAPWPRTGNRRGVLVARHATTIAAAVGVTNRRSQNLWAELILRSLGAFGGGEGGIVDGTFEGGARVVRRAIWPDGEVPEGFVQEDGSGLSRGNRSTVGALADVLFRIYRSEHGLLFMSSLAKGGDPEGTLRKRFHESRFEGRVLAKTGTLRDTSALAGFVRTENDRVLIFVVLAEGQVWRARALQDAVVGALIDG